MDRSRKWNGSRKKDKRQKNEMAEKEPLRPQKTNSHRNEKEAGHNN